MCNILNLKWEHLQRNHYVPYSFHENKMHGFPDMHIIAKHITHRFIERCIHKTEFVP